MNSEIKASWTRKLLPLQIAFQARYNMAILFGRGNGDSSLGAGGVNWPIAIVDDVSPGKAIRVPILLHVSLYLISVTKLWDMIIRLCIFKGRMGHAKVLDTKLHWLTTNELDMVLLVTVKSEH